MGKQTTSGLLKKFLSDDLECVYVHITKRAIDWVIAGFIDEANQLLEQLWNFEIPHSSQLWLEDEGLQILWQLSKNQPANIPYNFKTISAIESENWKRHFYPAWHQSFTDKFINKPIETLHGQELLVKAITSVYEKTENPDKVLDELKRYITEETPQGHSNFLATTSGALLAAESNKYDIADYFITLWGQGYLNYPSNYCVSALMRNTKCAERLLTGILAPVFQLNSEIIQSETKEIINALTTRIRSGRTLVYEDLSWRQLLNRISEIAITQMSISFPEDILSSGTLTKNPATSNEIRTAEDRLGIRFPEDYKNFLLTSNGFESFSNTGVTLAPVNKVDYLAKVDEQLVDIWDTSLDDPAFGSKLSSSIIIGGHQEEQQLLLIPLSNDQWQCWLFASWQAGEKIYESFRFYMEDELQTLEANF